VIRFCSLGSGSTGNATLVEAHDGMRTTRVLVDCGFTLRQLAKRLARHGLVPADLDAVFITHEHSDHVGCATALARRFGLPLWVSEGTWRAATRGAASIPALRIARSGEPVAIGALELLPFAVPHDAAEPLQLTFSDGARRLAVLTDLGHGPSWVVERLQRCDALLLECNHDRAMLETGPYPVFLKRRIGGERGHLANHQAAAILEQCRHAGLKHVVAAHLSQHNNRPELAALTISSVLGGASGDVVVAHAVDGSPWLDLH
jgi:phosphoribosyl 1,2-cyclic phosphodiesterase